MKKESLRAKKQMNLKFLVIPSNYFQWLLGYFKIFGLYPPKEHTKRIIYYFFCVPHIFLTMLSIILDLLNIVLNQETFERKMLNIGVLSMHTAAGLRVLSWLWTKKKFEEVIEVIGRSTFDFDIFAYEGQRKISKKQRASVDIFRTTSVTRTNIVCCGIFITVLVYIFLNIFITYACNYFQDTYEKFNTNINATSVYRDFPYPMWFPFDVSVSHGHYLIAFLYEPYAYCNLMASFWCVDWLVLSSIIQLQNQLTVVCFALKQVDRNVTKVKTRNLVIIKKVRLTKCVQELNEIYSAANLLEELCNKQLLIQNSLATFIFCTLLYVLTTLTVAVEISSISTATGIVLLEPLIQCWICQNFTLEFSKVLKSVYELDWTDYPPELRKFLVVTMARLKKPAVFTLGKWTTIDISFYIQLLKMTYSFYTLINRQNKRNT